MITRLKDWRLLVENIKITKQSIFDYIEWQDTSRDLYPGFSQTENKFTDEYFFDTKKQADEYAKDLIDLFTSLPDPIAIYRCIKAKSEHDIDLEMPGESWSYEKQSALNFGNRNNSNFLLSAAVYKKDVNWQGTFKAYTLFSGNFSDDDEHEIVVDDWTALKNIKIENIK